MAEHPLQQFSDEEADPGATDPRHFMYRTHASNLAIVLLVCYSLLVSAAIALVGADRYSHVTCAMNGARTDAGGSPGADGADPAAGAGRADDDGNDDDCGDTLSPDASLLILVALAGALGGLVHLLTSLGHYVGQRRFMRSWTLFYVFRPVAGSGLAIIVYFTVRMATPTVAVKDLSLFAILSFATLSGLFARQALEKLADIFDTMFEKVGKEVEEKPLSTLTYHPDEDPVPPPSGRFESVENVTETPEEGEPPASEGGGKQS